MGCTSAKTTSSNSKPIKRINEVLYWETDVWKLSGLPMDQIKRKFVKVILEGNTLQIRTAIVNANNGKNGPAKETLVLCHDYMDGASTCWFPYIKELSEHFRLIMPDLGTYGANTRLSDCEEVNRTGDVAERFILDWWIKWV